MTARRTDATLRRRAFAGRKGARTAHVPGEPELWIFLLGDLLVFAVFFAIWAAAAAHEPHVFAVGRQDASQTLGLINTAALLTSSWIVASAVLASRQSDHARAAVLLRRAMLLGALFVAIKGIEYTLKARHGVDVQGSAFDAYYFVFTGLHLGHVLIGIAALGYARRRCLHPRAVLEDQRLVEGTASYWHVVDVLWIVLFLLIYLL